MKYFLLTILVFSCLTFTSYAQTGKNEKKKNKRTEQAERDNAYSPFSPAESAVESGTRSKKEKKSRRAGKQNGESFSDVFNRKMDQKVVDFRKRMKQNAKDDRKEARLMKKPQYSDPMYFGHKKKPKKRPLGKRKFCKECGIVH